MRWTDKEKVMPEWYAWFAWYPVRLNGKIIWLERLMRKDTYHYGGFGDCVIEFELREMEK